MRGGSKDLAVPLSKLPGRLALNLAFNLHRILARTGKEDHLKGRIGGLVRRFVCAHQGLPSKPFRLSHYQARAGQRKGPRGTPYGVWRSSLVKENNGALASLVRRRPASHGNDMTLSWSMDRCRQALSCSTPLAANPQQRLQRVSVGEP